MRRIITNLILILAAFGPLHGAESDAMEGLIEKERTEEKVKEADDTPPPAYLFGDARSVGIYAWALYGGEPSSLCEPVPFDELIDMSDGDLGDEETVLNMKFPRVREAVERSCLIRPGDDILAVGKGEQAWVTIREFRIRRDRAFCRGDSPYLLLGRLDKKLDEEPLFYTTSPDIKEGKNNFQVLSFERTDGASLKDEVFNVGDYTVTKASVNAANVDAFYFLTRKIIRQEDDGFPSAILLWQKGNQITILTQEQVDSIEGTGRLRMEGVLDFNQDGYLDIWVRGDQKKCNYRLLYEGTPDGFVPVELPNTPCSC